jgi:ribose transport system permease protein
MSDPENSPRAPSKGGVSFDVRMLLQSLGPLIALMVVVAVFGVLDQIYSKGRFLTSPNLVVLLSQMSVVAVAALGMTVIILAGGVDLSVGYSVSLCATVLAYGLKAGWPQPVVLLTTLGTGCLCGFLNGVLVSYGRIVPFIVTLGTMTIFLGIGNRISDNATITPGRNQTPQWLAEMMSTRSTVKAPTSPSDGAPSAPTQSRLVIPTGVYGWVALAIVIAAMLRWTVFGRHIKAIGSNERAAMLCGIRVERVKLAVYILAGLTAAIAGIYQFSNIKIGNPNENRALELNAIAAVVIGGGSLRGGRASVLGTLCGAALMSVIRSGCDQLGVRNFDQQVIIGTIIVAAVALDQWRSGHKD